VDKIFLSYSFDPDDEATRNLLGYVDTILRSYGLRHETGAALGGGGLTEEIQRRIAACDALISILAPRGDADAAGQFGTSPFVLSEFQHARSIEKPCVAVLFPSVQLAPALGEDRERVRFDPADPAPALLKLVATVGFWKEQVGRAVKVRVEPEELARRLAQANGGARCQARVNSADGGVGHWQDVRVSRQPGGAFVTLRVPSDSLIQLRAYVDGETWLSIESPQYVLVPLEREV
jgi:hypothetical protein